MNILENLSDVFPVIIFVFWVIFGVVIKNVVKKQVKPAASEQHQQSGDEEPAKKRGGTKLKDALQLVLEEMELTERQNVALPEHIPEPQNIPPQASSEENSSGVSEAKPEIAVEDVLGSLEKRPYIQDILHPYKEHKKKTAAILGRTVDSDELRRGIIWSEILSPPLSLREPR